MRIDRKKLKLKWALDLYQELEGFPTREDCLYLLVKTLEENEMLDKEFNIHNVWGGMKSLHHNGVNIQNFLESISDAEGGHHFIKRTTREKRTWSDVLVEHPWMENQSYPHE